MVIMMFQEQRRLIRLCLRRAVFSCLVYNLTGFFSVYFTLSLWLSPHLFLLYSPNNRAVQLRLSLAEEVEEKKRGEDREAVRHPLGSLGQHGQTSSIAYLGVERSRAAESRFMCFINSVICSQTHPRRPSLTLCRSAPFARVKEVMKPSPSERKLLAWSRLSRQMSCCRPDGEETSQALTDKQLH